MTINKKDKDFMTASDVYDLIVELRREKGSIVMMIMSV